MSGGVLILGGGIIGAGVARDAAMRGLPVTLVERHTVGSGTSSRSSRLIHGGIRYLEQGDIHLVHEALAERAILLRIAPHLVRAAPFLFLLDRGEYAEWLKVGAGVVLYRLLAIRHALGPHHPVSRRDVLEREPLLGQAPIEGGALYQDAHGDDIGLVRSNIRSAVDAGARVIERADADVVVGPDRITATVRDGSTLHADLLVLALGPWTDTVRRAIGLADRRLVGGTKGSHITFATARFPLRHALALRHPDDHRVMFAIPEPENGRVLAGTTDLETNESPDDVRASEQEIDYLLRAMQHLFPALHFCRDDVTSSWAGIRPLLRQGGAPSARTREHLVLTEERVITVAGGKLTTYRRIAEETVDRIGEVLGIDLPPSRTAVTPLP
ncbi:MAG: glycerol-3-phosphate dehydrogenase/oxidase [Gemmatimonadales bacterium]